MFWGCLVLPGSPFFFLSNSVTAHDGHRLSKLNIKRRKYRAEFGVNIGTSVSPETFEEIEKLSKKFGIPKAQIVRRLVLRGLAEYDRDGMLPR